jgi:hypothetical protein
MLFQYVCRRAPALARVTDGTGINKTDYFIMPDTIDRDPHTGC